MIRLSIITVIRS
uniref:Uncharacterized protein n=1 Tax=Rhizophora mucronata TaxID=61149 RepID=A0A2P2QCE5_RHIMU